MSVRNVRGLIYRMGFRPRFGSIFFSPALHWRYYFLDGMEAYLCANTATESLLTSTLGELTESLGCVAPTAQSFSRLGENPFRELYPEFYGPKASGSTDVPNTRSIFLDGDDDEEAPLQA